MKRVEKETVVAEFRSRIEKAQAVYLTDFSGLDVKSMTVLRDELRKSGADYVVVKNRLAKRALADLDDYPPLDTALTGPTGFIFGYEGAVEPAKAVSDFAREHDDRPVFKIGILDRDLLEPTEIARIADLPPRDQLMAQLLGALQGPMVNLAMVMQGKLREVGALLQALNQEKEKQEGG